MTGILAQVSPALFRRIEKDFDVLDDIFFRGIVDDSTFNSTDDVLVTDYQAVLEPLFQAIAVEMGFKPEDYDDCPEVQAHPWYKAFLGANVLKGYDLQYGEATYHRTKEVRHLAQELAALEKEILASAPQNGFQSDCQNDAGVFSAFILEARDDGHDSLETSTLPVLSQFFRRAAQRGCMVVCGIE